MMEESFSRVARDDTGHVARLTGGQDGSGEFVHTSRGRHSTDHERVRRMLRNGDQLEGFDIIHAWDPQIIKSWCPSHLWFQCYNLHDKYSCDTIHYNYFITQIATKIIVVFVNRIRYYQPLKDLLCESMVISSRIKTDHQLPGKSTVLKLVACLNIFLSWISATRIQFEVRMYAW